MAKKPAAKAATTKRTRTTAAAREETAALKAEALAMTGTPDPMTGQTMTHPDDAPTIKQVKEARKAAVEEQFAAADENGEPGYLPLRRANTGF